MIQVSNEVFHPQCPTLLNLELNEFVDSFRYSLPLDPDEIIESQCQVQYLLQDESFFKSHLSNLFQTITGVFDAILALACSDKTAPVLNERITQPSRHSNDFDEIIAKTLSRGYTLVSNPFRGTSQSLFLVNRGGYKVAILKYGPDDLFTANWKEISVRYFDKEGFFNFPRITEVDLEKIGLAIAIEYIPETSWYREDIYLSLSKSDLASAIESRQRIFILDQLTQNHDRHIRNILYGCESGKAIFYPIDHDMALNDDKCYRRLVDPCYGHNLFLDSKFTPANKRYLKELNHLQIDEIPNKRFGKLHTYYKLPTTKIIATLLKIASEMDLTIIKTERLADSVLRNSDLIKEQLDNFTHNCCSEEVYRMLLAPLIEQKLTS